MRKWGVLNERSTPPNEEVNPLTYLEALERIQSSERFGSRPGLERVGSLTRRLGNPQNSLKFVHVAGTNGKGSTCAMTASILRSAGYRTGLYVSPYIDDFRERIQIDGDMIAPDDLATLTERVFTVIDEMIADGEEHPTEFEIVTAMAFCHFQQRDCDIVVLEVGLGGRFDATNIIGPPEVAVITPIALDHMAYLGDNTRAIAFEKCGIIKPGTVAVTCVMQDEQALHNIREHCVRTDVYLRMPQEGLLTYYSADLSGSDIAIKGMRFRLPLAGAHQIQNALTVWETVLALRSRGYNIPDVAVIDGFQNTVWGGRLEAISQKPLCLLDGAHNQSGVEALSAALDSLLSDRELIVVMGMSNDKDFEMAVPKIASRANIFIATEPHNPRALDTHMVAQSAARDCPLVFAEPNLEQAVQKAFSLAKPQDVVLICGSLYLLGDAKKEWLSAGFDKD